MTTKLLIAEERKALIDKLVERDAAEYFSIVIGKSSVETGKIRKNIRRLYNKCDDAKLLSIKI